MWRLEEEQLTGVVYPLVHWFSLPPPPPPTHTHTHTLHHHGAIAPSRVPCSPLLTPPPHLPWPP